ncbi:MAG: hypothetical protein ACYC7E_03390 [Armatimonadota bacterium]
MLNSFRMPLLQILLYLLLLPTALPGFTQGTIPQDPLAFHRWLVDSRIALAHGRAPLTAATPEERLPYKGCAEDFHIVILYACGYGGEWSRYHHDPDLVRRSTILLDDYSSLYANTEWRGKHSTGLDPQFTLHAYALAVFLWKETNAMPKEKIIRWTATARALADNAIALNTGFMSGDYANPELYMLSGLATVAKLTGEDRYRAEAAECLRRYADDFYPDGGMSYFMDSNPQLGYQGMVTLGAAIYDEMTGDPLAKEMLARIARYYCQALHPLGFQPPYESPVLKQNWNYPFFCPSAVRLAALLSDDAEASWMAGVVEQRYREGLQENWPTFLREKHKGAYWHNYQAAKYSVFVLRYWKAVPTKPIAARRVEADSNHRGGRVVWDTFAGFFTTRPFSPTRAGCAVMDPAEPFVPLNAALAMALPEALETRKSGARTTPVWLVLNDRRPYQSLTSLPGKIQAMTQGNRLTQPYWADLPMVEGEAREGADYGCWRAVETWALLPNLLVGLIHMRALTDGGTAGADWARIRFILYPHNRQFTSTLTGTPAAPVMIGTYGLLDYALQRIDGADWELQVVDGATQPPIQQLAGNTPKQEFFALKQPALVKQTIPWKQNDSVTLACAWAPAASKALNGVAARMVHPRVAALAVRDTDQHTWIVVSNQSRRFNSVKFTPARGWQVAVTRGNATFRPSPLDGVARIGMLGESHALIEITAPQGELPPAGVLLTRLALTGGRGLPETP